MHSQPGSATPVFVDGTGRRRRLTVIAGTAVGLGLLTSLALVTAGIFLDTSVPLPGWSDTPRETRPVEAGVDGINQPRVVRSPSPSPRTSAPPLRPTPTASDRTSVTATGAPSASDRPGRGDEHRNTAKPTRSQGKPQ